MESLVIIVDADAGVRSSLSRLLTHRGYRTQQYTCAEDCLVAITRQSTAACVIVDFRLPGIGAIELQHALPYHLTFVGMTDHPEVASVVATMAAGAIDYLEKPISEVRLLAAVAKAIALANERYACCQEIETLRGKLYRLTPREYEVMSLIATGLRNKEFASILGTVEKTIKAHRANVMAKLELKSLPDLVRFADSWKIGLSLARKEMGAVTSESNHLPEFESLAGKF